MEELLDNELVAANASPAYKLYSDRSVRIGSILGGPMAAGYLVAANYNALGERRKALITWLIASVFMIAVVALVTVVPALQKGGVGFAVAYSFLIAYLAKYYQGHLIQKHIENGGEMFSTWRSAGIGLIGLVVVILIGGILVALVGDAV